MEEELKPKKRAITVYSEESVSNFIFTVVDNWAKKTIHTNLVKDQLTEMIEKYACPLEPLQKGPFRFYCGSCGKRIFIKRHPRYCEKCGQSINWRKEEKK